MNRSILKTFISSFIALVLVYYSVAWAMLSCAHDEDFAITEVIVSDAGARDAGFYQSLASQAQSHLDCMESDYHTETLGGFLGPLQERLLSTDIASHITDLSILHGVNGQNGNSGAERYSTAPRVLIRSARRAISHSQFSASDCLSSIGFSVCSRLRGYMSDVL